MPTGEATITSRRPPILERSTDQTYPMEILKDLLDNRPKAWEITLYADEQMVASPKLTPKFGYLRQRSLKEAENQVKTELTKYRPNYEFTELQRNEELLILEAKEYDGIYHLCTSPTYRFEIRFVDITKNELKDLQITSE